MLNICIIFRKVSIGATSNVFAQKVTAKCHFCAVWTSPRHHRLCSHFVQLSLLLLHKETDGKFFALVMVMAAGGCSWMKLRIALVMLNCSVAFVDVYRRQIRHSWILARTLSGGLHANCAKHLRLWASCSTCHFARVTALFDMLSEGGRRASVSGDVSVVVASAARHSYWSISYIAAIWLISSIEAAICSRNRWICCRHWAIWCSIFDAAAKAI